MINNSAAVYRMMPKMGTHFLFASGLCSAAVNRKLDSEMSDLWHAKGPRKINKQISIFTIPRDELVPGSRRQIPDASGGLGGGKV